jgi:putative transposase
MRKSRFTEAQIIGMIKEQEAGLPTAELCRKHGLSPATFVSVRPDCSMERFSRAAGHRRG